MKKRLLCLLGLMGWLSTALVAQGDAVQPRHDIPFLAAERPEKLDLFLPVLPKGKLAPAVVWIHGGGWTIGDKAQAREQNVGRNLAAAGYVVASINYQLGAGAWPQNLLDCKNAVRFLRVHAAEYGVDPTRIAVAGGSAGGHLALMVAFTADREWEPATPYPGVSNAVRAVIDLYGPTNLLTRVETDDQGRPTGKLKEANAARVFGGSRTGNPVPWRAGSPVNHVHTAVPPVLILHGDRDATVDLGQSVELDGILTAQGVVHEFTVVKNAGHSFDLEKWEGKPLSVDLRSLVLDFLEKHLMPGAP